MQALKPKKQAAIDVRRADLSQDRILLLSALESFLAAHRCEDRYEWLYLRGPFGPARVWLLTDGEQGSVAGVAALFPRLLLDGGKAINGCVFGDFCLAPAWRSLGPGLRLQKACIQELSRTALFAGYDFPSAGMMAIYQRLGYRSELEMVRMAKPLRMDRKVRERIRSAPAAAALSGFGNQFLQWKDELVRKKSDWQVAPESGPIGEEFTDLASRPAGPEGVRVLRTAAYVQWRFCEHPFRRYVILTARRKGKLCGYLVFTQDEGQTAIVDVFGEDKPEMVAALIQSAVDISRERGDETLNISLLRNHPWKKALSKMGFYEREAHPVMICAPEGSAMAKQWFLTDGDRES
jgi:GNAT superfamily N-acetyltransferase